ncbi:uncharacterized protein LOC126671437 [Mercurialis annua]|uniref:uncharacterized protein LOC126671437 n=1 Tax=Mercurialis annua TaxID=3986 RepID=UPI00215E0EFB|nr:uncharacterized protein LOC126671437 [Mercurialis annua]
MVSKSLKKTPTKSIKDRRRRQKKKSPAKISCSGGGSSSNAIFASINKTIYTCKRRLAKIFSKLAKIGTPNSRYKGYKILKKGLFKDRKMKEDEISTQEHSICKALFVNEKLPPLISAKRTVFLDLDETLVHSKADPPPHFFDFVVKPNIEGEIMNFYVLKRPGVEEFLEALAVKYEVVVFTAGLKAYASLVLDKIDKKGVISHRLYRDSCREVDGKYVKDLSEMGRDLKKVVIVDDNPNCYSLQPANAIPIKAFIDDLRDGELGKLTQFFNGCDGCEDMRVAVKKFVGEGVNKKVNV